MHVMSMRIVVNSKKQDFLLIVRIKSGMFWGFLHISFDILQRKKMILMGTFTIQTGMQRKIPLLGPVFFLCLQGK